MEALPISTPSANFSFVSLSILAAECTQHPITSTEKSSPILANISCIAPESSSHKKESKISSKKYCNLITKGLNLEFVAWLK
jgi:hypothetical protein